MGVTRAVSGTRGVRAQVEGERGGERAGRATVHCCLGWLSLEEQEDWAGVGDVE